jgi:peptidoglycan/LPS O-acetylase OafA/YrhL
MPETNIKRKHYIDNLRSIIVLTVMLYHVVYLFNTVGVPKNIGMEGIRAFDGLCYVIYPWAMVVVFLLAGMSARSALQKRTVKQFLDERLQKLLIPLQGGMFLLGWLNVWVAYRYVDAFEGNYFRVILKYLSLMVGPLWFNIELLLVSIITVFLKKTDKKDRIWPVAGNATVVMLLLLAIPFWGSSFLFNIPAVIVFRNGVYLFVFLAGYYFFSHEKVIEKIAKYRYILLVCGILLGIAEVSCFFGKNFTINSCLQHPLTNFYAWIMLMALLGISKAHLDFNNRFLEYLKSRSFYWYLCHYPVMALFAYLLTTFFKFQMAYNYIILLITACPAAVLFCEIVCKIPGLRYLLFGIKKEK